MAYETYTTDALVCGSYERLGAHKSIQLFTREAGMLFAVARSVREERSRQRFALQEFAELRVSLIRGRAGWRIGSVESRGSAYTRAKTRAARGSIVALTRLTRRFITGEESVPAVFDELTAALAAIADTSAASADCELLASVRMLRTLGYVPASAVPQELDQIAYANVAEVLTPASRADLRRLIDEATVQSQL